MPDTVDAASIPSALFAQRPTFTVDGTEIPALARDLITLVVAEDVEGPYWCEATFTNFGAAGPTHDYSYLGRDMLDFGKTIEVLVGSDVIFAGRIVSLTGAFPEGSAPTITVRADDRLIDLRMTRRSRSFADSSLSDVASSIASNHGLSADVNVSGPTMTTIAQVNQSDLAFIHALCRDAGAEAWVRDTTLHVADRAHRNANTVVLSYGNELREVSITADVAGQRTSLTVSGWSVAGKEAIASRAEALPIAAETGGGESGASILRTTFGDRDDVIAHTAPASTDEARATAEARFRGMARRFVVARGTAHLSSQLRVGAHAALRFVGPLFAGEYYVRSVRHRFDATVGLRTEFEAERAWLGRPG